MKQIIAFTVISLKMYFRTREAVLWNFIFPVFLFIIYVTAFAGMYGESLSKEAAVADNLAKILTITFMSGGLFSLAISITVLREKGIFRRYQVTPVRPSTLVIGLILRHLVFMSLVTVFLFLIAKILYGATFAGNILDWIVVSLLGIFTFGALGFCVAAFAKTNQAASGIGNIFFMPLMFLSGATIPYFLFPQWLKNVASFLPSTHLNNLLQASLVYGKTPGQILKPAMILLGFGIAFVILASLLSRRNEN